MEHIIYQFLLTWCQKKRNEHGYDILKKFYLKRLATSSILSKKNWSTWNPNFTMENLVFRYLNFFWPVRCVDRWCNPRQSLKYFGFRFKPNYMCIFQTVLNIFSVQIRTGQHTAKPWCCAKRSITNFPGQLPAR